MNYLFQREEKNGNKVVLEVEGNIKHTSPSKLLYIIAILFT